MLTGGQGVDQKREGAGALGKREGGVSLQTGRKNPNIKKEIYLPNISRWTRLVSGIGVIVITLKIIHPYSVCC